MINLRVWQILPMLAMFPLTILAVDYPMAAIVPTILIATCCGVNVVAAIMIDLLSVEEIDPEGE